MSQKPKAYTRLKAAADQLGWVSDIEILVVGGFLVRNLNIDPDKFTTATSTYAHESGLPVDLVIKVLCGLIDEIPADASKTVDPFSEYLAGVIDEYRKLKPQQVPELVTEAAPELLHVDISVSPETVCEIDSALKQERPLTDSELGEALVKWSCQIDKDCTCYIDVINAEPSPAMCISLVKHGKSIYRHRPVRIKQWNTLSTTDGSRSVFGSNDAVDFRLVFREK